MKLKRIPSNIFKFISLIFQDRFVFFYFKDWISSLLIKNYNSPYPWLTYRFIKWASRNFKKDTTLLEFGSGNSTMFFSKLCNHVISIEHNKDWYEKVKGFISDSNVLNVNLYYKSGDEYIDFAKSLPDNYLDIVLIDGVNRCQCFLAVLDKVKDNGLIILDNAERKEYDLIHERLKSKKTLIFQGLSPYNMKITTTKIWIK
jgi:predicted O-methyltransferase YrrM